MEDETPSVQKTSPLFATMSILGLGIAVIATAIGGIALKKISATADSITARVEKNAAMELEIKKISDRVDALALQVSDLKSGDDNKIKNLATQVQRVVDTLNSNINEVRGEVVKNREALEKLATRSVAKTVVKKTNQNNRHNLLITKNKLPTKSTKSKMATRWQSLQRNLMYRFLR